LKPAALTQVLSIKIESKGFIDKAGSLSRSIPFSKPAAAARATSVP
jgi:hypothetical protein